MKITYYSDGLTEQFKNYKNMVCQCFCYSDFAFNLQWIVFATSHGKSACDGIGGTVKHLIQKEIFDRLLSN